jgi:hypothetical protein
MPHYLFILWNYKFYYMYNTIYIFLENFHNLVTKKKKANESNKGIFEIF